MFLGGGIGPLVGGLLVSSLGYRTAFQIMAAICAGVASLYFLIYHLYLKKRSRQSPAPVAPEETKGREPAESGTKEEVKLLSPLVEDAVFVSAKTTNENDHSASQRNLATKTQSVSN